MKTSSLLAVLLVALLAGCPTTITCPAGTTFMFGVCVAGDAGPPEDDAGPTDAPIEIDAPAPSDAGPCGGLCEGTALPLCDTSIDTCVECLAPTDCSAPDLACVAGACEQCDGNEDCTSADTSRCNLTTNICENCLDDTSCGHDGLGGICDTAGGGVCVVCTADDELACGSNVCDVATAMCSTTPANSAGLCETCISDRQCNAGQVCVAMTWDDPATGAVETTAVGQYCLWRRDATEAGAPMGSCASNGRPYFRTDIVTTVSGAGETVCALQVSTCESHADYRITNCMTLDATGDALCGGAGLADGFCRAVDAVTNRCTVGCTTNDDCPAPFTCNTGVSPRVCRL